MVVRVVEVAAVVAVWSCYDSWRMLPSIHSHRRVVEMIDNAVSLLAVCKMH